MLWDRNALVDHADAVQQMWRASADETAAVAVQAAGPGLKPGSRAQQLAAWAKASQELLGRLQQHVWRLMGA